MYKYNFSDLLVLVDLFLFFYTLISIQSKLKQNQISYFLFWKISNPKHILYVLIFLYVFMIIFFMMFLFAFSNWIDNNLGDIFQHPEMAVIYASLIIQLFLYNYKNLFLKTIINIFLSLVVLVNLLYILVLIWGILH